MWCVRVDLASHEALRQRAVRLYKHHTVMFIPLKMTRGGNVGCPRRSCLLRGTALWRSEAKLDDNAVLCFALFVLCHPEQAKRVEVLRGECKRASKTKALVPQGSIMDGGKLL